MSGQFPPRSPVPRSKSAPGSLHHGEETATPHPSSGAAAPPLPPPPPAPTRTFENQGEPDDNLGAPDDDIKDPMAWRNLDTLVALLMSPPKNLMNPKDNNGNVMKDRVLIRLEWVKKTVSEKHFIADPSKGRSVLRNDSKLRTHGKLAGLPKRLYDWLCGDAVDTIYFGANRDALWISRGDFVLFNHN